MGHQHTVRSAGKLQQFTRNENTIKKKMGSAKYRKHIVKITHVSSQSKNKRDEKSFYDTSEGLGRDLQKENSHNTKFSFLLKMAFLDSNPGFLISQSKFPASSKHSHRGVKPFAGWEKLISSSHVLPQVLATGFVPALILPE